MAWSTSYTAATNDTLSAANWNQAVRDNLLATEVAIAPAGWGYRYVSTGSHAVALRSTLASTVTTSQTTSSTTFADLATVGPTVTTTTGAKALCVWSAWLSSSTADAASRVSVAGGGVAASVSWAAIADGVPANTSIPLCSMHMFTGLTAGSNTFTMKYEATSGTATFSNRVLMVYAL